jgi:hypothetical protein
MLSRIESYCEPELTFFVPVSATGCPPAGKDEQGYYHLAGNIKPMWAEVPLLTLMHTCVPHLLVDPAR